MYLSWLIGSFYSFCFFDFTKENQMNLAQSSMALLAFVIAAMSIWWIGQTFKEGRKAIEDSKR